MPSLAQATDGASADDRARHGLKLTGQACQWPSARRGRPEPSAAIVQIAFLAYLVSVRGYEGSGFTAVTRRQR